MLPRIIFRIERWKFNKEYGIYVSTLGNFKDRYKRTLPIKIDSKTGYCSVKTESPSSPWKKVHRLVMLTWRPIPDAENLTVDHLDHNKRNNSLSNLEWVTAEENQKRAKEDRIFVNEPQIIKIKVNNKIIDNDFNKIYQEVLTYYPSGYPKKALLTRLNQLYCHNKKSCKVGQAVILSIVYCER